MALFSYRIWHSAGFAEGTIASSGIQEAEAELTEMYTGEFVDESYKPYESKEKMPDPVRNEIEKVELVEIRPIRVALPTQPMEAKD